MCQIVKLCINYYFLIEPFIIKFLLSFIKKNNSQVYGFRCQSNNFCYSTTFRVLIDQLLLISFQTQSATVSSDQVVAVPQYL